MKSNEKNIITFFNTNGEEQEAEVVLCFTAGQPAKDYIIYTFNEKDKNGMVIIYSAILIEDNDSYRLESITNDNEWSMVKEVMRDIVMKGKDEE